MYCCNTVFLMLKLEYICGGGAKSWYSDSIGLKWQDIFTHFSAREIALLGTFLISISFFKNLSSVCRYHDTIERYCDETDTWEIVGEMPTSRSSLSCVSLLLRKDIHISSCPGTPNDNWLQVLGRWKAFTGYYMPRYWETTQGRVVNFLLKWEAWVGHSSVRAESQFLNRWQLEG